MDIILHPVPELPLPLPNITTPVSRSPLAQHTASPEDTPLPLARSK